jgi:uncharacterized protein YkwD
MLKTINTHKHHLFISILTFIIIASIILLPVLSTPSTQESKIKTPNQFINLVNRNLKVVSSSSNSNSFTKSSSIISSSILLSNNSSIISSISQQPKAETKIIEEIKLVIAQPIKPIPVENIEPQNEIVEKVVPPKPNVEELPKALPKPIIRETPKVITQTVIESKPLSKEIIAPAQIIEPPKPNIDNLFTTTGCDQSQASQMLNIVNNHRAANGTKALSFSGQLTGIACSHSKWMSDSGIFSHTGRDNTSPFERCKKAGTYCYAENVAYNTIPNVQDLFDQFKNSPGHNLNMLDPNFVEIGIAFDGIYVTQVFR